MPAEKCGYLRLHFRKNLITYFLPLLQQGFEIDITAENIQDRLCGICDTDPERLHALIQTVFLNGKPVDDMETASIQNGDCLALSAAMPGLVGATMRTGGVLAGLRRTISYRSPQGRSENQGGRLTIKLFNLLIKEIGPLFLQKGIFVKIETLRNLLSSLSEADWTHCEKAVWNDQRIEGHTLVDRVWPEELGRVRLGVTFGES
jgi:hypothetical protein